MVLPYSVSQKCQSLVHFRLCTLHIILDTFSSYLHFAFHFIFPQFFHNFLFHLAFVYGIISALITRTAGGGKWGVWACQLVSLTTSMSWGFI